MITNNGDLEKLDRELIPIAKRIRLTRGDWFRVRSQTEESTKQPDLATEANETGEPRTPSPGGRAPRPSRSSSSSAAPAPTRKRRGPASSPESDES